MVNGISLRKDTKIVNVIASASEAISRYYIANVDTRLPRRFAPRNDNVKNNQETPIIAEVFLPLMSSIYARAVFCFFRSFFWRNRPGLHAFSQQGPKAARPHPGTG